jgi:hypothetical protein
VWQTPTGHGACADQCLGTLNARQSNREQKRREAIVVNGRQHIPLEALANNPTTTEPQDRDGATFAKAFCVIVKLHDVPTHRGRKVGSVKGRASGRRRDTGARKCGRHTLEF